MKQVDARQARSQQKLQQAYLTLLAQGNTQMSIQQICQEASVTRPTFYKQYKDIHALRLDIHETLLAQLKEALTITSLTPLSESAQQDVYRNVYLLFSYIKQNKQSYELLLIQYPDALFIHSIKQLIRQFIREGTEISKTESMLIQQHLPFVLSYYTGAYYETIVFWIEQQYEPAEEIITRRLVDLSMQGPFGKDFFQNYS